VHDDEFMFALNRHAIWSSGAMTDGTEMVDGWLATNNPDYATAFDARAADWTVHNLPAPSAGFRHDGAPGGDGRGNAPTPWRTIEAGIRAGGSWPASFFGFQRAPQFRASTRCAMVAAMSEHGRFLRQFGDTGNSNWKSMQVRAPRVLVSACR
jgi:hypothetical protein